MNKLFLILSIIASSQLLEASFVGWNTLDKLNTARSEARSSSYKATETPLMKAAKSGDFKKCESLIKNNAKINVKINYINTDNMTALRLAVENNHLSICELLVNNGADVNIKSYWGDNRSALADAIQYGNLEICNFLIQNGADVNSKISTYPSLPPLLFAMGRSEYEIAQALVDAGAYVNVKDSDGETPLMKAAHGGCEELCQLLLAKKAQMSARTSSGLTPLHYIVQKEGLEKMCEEFIRGGAPVNARDWDGNTVLMSAIKSHNIEMCEILIKSGADISECNKEGKTPLMVAVESRNLDGCKLLVKQGVELEAKGHDGNTALMLAIVSGSTEIFKYLVKSGAGIEVKNKSREETLLMLAARFQRKEICRFLINEKNVDIHERDYYGYSALLKVVQNPNKELWNMLVAAGATLDDRDLNRLIKKKLHCTTLLMKASKEGCKGICEALLRSGAEVNAHDSRDMTPLIHATFSGDKETCDFLIRNGADINADAPLRSTHSRYTPLTYAAQKGNFEICELLVNRGSDLEGRAYAFPFTYAIKSGNKEICKLLLQKGQFVGSGDLHNAIQEKKLGVYEVLVTHACMIPDAKDVKKAVHRVKGALLYMQRAAKELKKNIPKEVRYKILISNDDLKQDVMTICFDLMHKGWTIPSHFKNMVAEKIIIYTKENLEKAMAAYHKAPTDKEKSLLGWNNFKLNFSEALAKNIRDCVWDDKYCRELLLPKEEANVDDGSCVIL